MRYYFPVLLALASLTMVTAFAPAAIAQISSQDRAQAVLDALRNRRVLTASYRVKGYGEMQPIADNGTEEGREANRRIAFRLIRPEPVEEEKTALEELEEAATEGDTEVPEAEQGTGE